MSEEAAELKETVKRLKKSMAMLHSSHSVTQSTLERLRVEVRQLRHQTMLMERAMNAMLEHQTAQLKKTSAPRWRTGAGVITGSAAVARATLVQAATEYQPRKTEPRPPKRGRSAWAPFFIALLSILLVVGSYLLGRMVFSHEVASWTAGLAGTLALFMCLVQLIPKKRHPDPPSTF